jgi:hypothetical protein
MARPARGPPVAPVAKRVRIDAPKARTVHARAHRASRKAAKTVGENLAEPAVRALLDVTAMTADTKPAQQPSREPSPRPAAPQRDVEDDERWDAQPCTD